MPDEYLPPNKILFIQQLPETASKESIEKIFKQFVFLSQAVLSADGALP
jgi:U2 small nuclear ribonucleoprotein B''